MIRTSYVALMLLMFTSVSRVNAEEIFVPTGMPDIATAVAACADGDTVTVLAGIYTNTPYTVIDFAGRAILLRSLQGPEMTVLRGEYSWIGISFDDAEGPDTVVEGFTFENFSLAVDCLNDASPTLRNLIFHDNYAGISIESGSAIRCVDASPCITGCVFEDNRSGKGGAVYIEGGAPTIVSSQFRGNIANRGGAVYCLESSASIGACTFTGNKAHSSLAYPSHSLTGHGGAIYVEGGTPRLEACLLLDNKAVVGSQYFYRVSGGGIYITGCSPTISQCTLVGNYAEDMWQEGPQGGAILCEENAAPVIRNSLIALNGPGGGILCRDGTSAPDIACCDFYGNTDGNFAGSCVDPTGLDGNIAANPVFCDAGNRVLSLGAGSPCLPANNDCGVLMGARGQGCATTAIPEDAPGGAPSLLPNHPNPFNPATRIEFNLPEPGSVTLTVWDVAGRRVATLLGGVPLEAGRHATVWRGIADDGMTAAAGVYFCRLKAAGREGVRKMTLLK